mmetsp:Transcript_24275/g.66409  ORF Transcript_24275/g.66409 Transcript_24275/m.66409 type:complete len:80 (-) Transcript_24275:281-520(-)|eukprot:61667-Pelagomonas_calceolata.AAC.2
MGSSDRCSSEKLQTRLQMLPLFQIWLPMASMPMAARLKVPLCAASARQKSQPPWLLVFALAAPRRLAHANKLKMRSMSL